MFSLHGLIRGENLELGRDADTGGQILYVVDLARHVSRLPGVTRVDLFTRRIQDRTVSEDYSQPVENLSDSCRIVRIGCGGKRYLRKEHLWPHLEEFVDGVVRFTRREGRKPDIVHGHYADAGIVAMRLSSYFGVPFVFTGHSLGRSKEMRLAAAGIKREEMIRKFRIDHRIAMEEKILTGVDLVITSTSQESTQQYGQYEGGTLPRFCVIPPGFNLEKFFPYVEDSARTDLDRVAHASLMDELDRFFLHPDRPLILALCRPDRRKNIGGLIEAYGKDKELQAMANIAIFAGLRKDISSMEDNERDVLTEMLLLMDKYDLYGKMAIPKRHDFEVEVPELYRIAAEKKGVFVNPALTEPFGLTIIEAAACGLPVVATHDGGPKDILSNLKNGILVDATSTKDISRAIRTLIVDEKQWRTCSKNGIVNARKIYTWDAHVRLYEKEIRLLRKSGRKRGGKWKNKAQPVADRFRDFSHLLITDIDNTLTGGKPSDLKIFLRALQDLRTRMGFGIATGRTLESTMKHLQEHHIPQPDVLITSVGSEINYGKDLACDSGWEAHISHRWDREAVLEALEGLSFLELQEKPAQRKLKVSYYMDFSRDNIAAVHHALSRRRLRYTLIHSHGSFLDILPYRASKGKAVRYLGKKWAIPLTHMITSGDSGNDEAMLRGGFKGIVVGNHAPEMKRLRGLKNLYFAKNPHTAGILEGLAHYGLVKIPKKGIQHYE